jgi:hypothetical protein
MSGSHFPAARAIALRLSTSLVQHMDNARSLTQQVFAELPPVDEIEQVIDSAFWASLRREEGVSPRISLALAPSESSDQPLLFAESLHLSPAALAHLAPAVERPGIHLGVWRSGSTLRMWGTTRGIPPFCLVVEVTAPGVLVFKHRHVVDSVKYVNIAVLDGDDVKIVDERVAAPSNCPQLLSFLLGAQSRNSWRDSGNVLVQLAVSMRSHKRGGLLLFVPESSNWIDSLAHPIAYAVHPPYTVLANVVRERTGAVDTRAMEERLRLAVDHVSGLTAVDGATVLTSTYDVRAFGAKIVRREHAAQVEQVLSTEPIEGRPSRVVNPTELGGTRHLSAAQFVHDQRDAFALVASQDGKFTVFEWSMAANMVHAHRVESLLL